MLHIAICDDDGQAAERNRDMALAALKNCGIACRTDVYTHSENLLYDILEDHFFFDLILLDIEMPGISGMALAEKVKTRLPDVKIIFITSHMEYAIDAFELNIFRYVPKNDMERRLTAAVTDAARLIDLESGQFYTVSNQNRLEKIPYRNIRYIHRDGKNSELMTEAGACKVRKSLQQVYEELNSSEFIFIDRGCIVNIIHIMKVCGNDVWLKDGQTLAVSRSHLPAVKQQINTFWGAHI